MRSRLAAPYSDLQKLKVHPRSTRRLRIRLISALAFVALTGCSGRPSSMVASTSPIPAGVRGTVPASGSDCQYYLLGIVPISSSASSQSALDEAKEDADVDVLTDVTIDEYSGYYLLFSNQCIRIEGKGVPREVLSEIEHDSPGRIRFEEPGYLSSY